MANYKKIFGILLLTAIVGMLFMHPEAANAQALTCTDQEQFNFAEVSDSSPGIVTTVAGQIKLIMHEAAEKLFIMEDWHNFGMDYYNTLMAWHQNFNEGWSKIKDHYDERFFRMWNYYLLYCAGGFKARELQLWQIVFSKKGAIQRYDAPR